MFKNQSNLIPDIGKASEVFLEQLNHRIYLSQSPIHSSISTTFKPMKAKRDKKDSEQNFVLSKS